jgi:hypothetical protein
VKKADLLLKKLIEYGIEDYGCFGGSISLFANDPKWDALPESARAEILELLDQQFEDMQG